MSLSKKVFKVPSFHGALIVSVFDKCRNVIKLKNIMLIFRWPHRSEASMTPVITMINGIHHDPILRGVGIHWMLSTLLFVQKMSPWMN